LDTYPLKFRENPQVYKASNAQIDAKKFNMNIEKEGLAQSEFV